MDDLLYKLSNKCSVRRSPFETLLRPINDDIELSDLDDANIYIKDKRSYFLLSKNMRKAIKNSQWGPSHHGLYLKSKSRLAKVMERMI